MRISKTVLLAFFLLLNSAKSITMAQHLKKNNSPHAGQYTLDQGGTDAAGGVHLLLFPKGDYAIVYFGGMQQGTWRTLADGNLELREWDGETVDFALYGRQDAALGNELQLDFVGFEESYAKVGLLESGDGLASVSLHPAFNDDANCYASSYFIKRPTAKLSGLLLAVYQEASRKQYEQVIFSKKLLYSFTLDKRYNHYRVIHIASASKPKMVYAGKFLENKLTLYPAGAASNNGMRGDAYGEREDISATDLTELASYIQSARQQLPARLAMNNDDGTESTYERVLGKSHPLQESAVHLLTPLFTARCN